MQRVAVIAGGTRGLGLALGRELARRGERVFLIGRSAMTQAEPAEVLRHDLSEPQGSQAALAQVLSRAGRIDSAVYAIGDVAHGTLSETSAERWGELWRSNVDGAVRFATAAREPLRESRGALLLYGVSGVSDLRGRRRIAAYASAKSALCVLARSLALEEGPRGVRVNVVAPGLVPHEDAAAETRASELAARVPLGRLGTPEELALAAAWLLSDAASYVTGQVLEVAGGYPPR